MEKKYVIAIVVCAYSLSTQKAEAELLKFEANLEPSLVTE